jgi:esterase/lipase superfamily enzyme
MQFVSPDLPRHVFGWHSHRLGTYMPIVRYGDYGNTLLLYPTAQSDFLDNERFFLIKVLEPLIFARKLNVFCIETINGRAWMNPHVPVPVKARLQALYSEYVEEEVVPHIRRTLRDPHARVGVAGASFGAFHAANQFFRRPDLFNLLVGMSGFYDLEGSYLHGFNGPDAYFNNPMWFVREMHPGSWQLEKIRDESRIYLLTGTGAHEAPQLTRQFSELLWSKGIWHFVDFWGHDMPHDWPTWRKMLPWVLEHKAEWIR